MTRHPVSALVEDLPRRLPPEATVADVIEALEDRAIGVVLAVISVPAIIPTPGVPAGMIFGTLLALIAIQATSGVFRPVLPGWLGRRAVSPWLVGALARRGPPLLRRIERLVRPRLTGLTEPRAIRWLGPVLFVLGVLIALPIPFGNTLPGLAALLIGLGTAGRDGLVVFGGVALAVVGAAASVALVLGGWWLAASVLALR